MIDRKESGLERPGQGERIPMGLKSNGTVAFVCDFLRPSRMVQEPAAEREDRTPPYSLVIRTNNHMRWLSARRCRGRGREIALGEIIERLDTS